MAVSQNLQLTQLSQNVADNTSRIRIFWESTQNNGSYNRYTRTAYYYVSVNGGPETQYSLEYILPGYSTVTILDAEITIPHNEQGEATVTVRTWMDTRISAGVVEMQQTISLTDIPRASALSLSVQEVTLAGSDTAITAEITPAVDTYSHTLILQLAEYYQAQSLEVGVLSGEILVPMSLAAYMPGASSAQAQVILKTFSGETLIGQKVKNLELRLADGISPYAQPTISGFSTERCTEDGTPSDDGLYVAVTASVTFSGLGGYNTMTAQVSYRPVDSSHWTVAGDFYPAGGNIYPLPDDEEYEIRLSATDKFCQVYALEILDTGEVLMEYHQRQQRMEFKPHVTFPSLGLCNEEDEEKAGLHLNESGEAYFDMGPMLQKVFSNGVWIGNAAPLGKTGTFTAQSGYSGFFIDTENCKVFVVNGTDMQNVYTGEAIAKFG